MQIIYSSLILKVMFVCIAGFSTLPSAFISVHMLCSCYDTVFLFRFSLHTEVIVVTFLMWRCGLLTTLWVVETRSPSNKSAL